MTSKQQVTLAYRVAIVLFVVGVFSYAAFSAPAPEQPVRIMFKSAAGKVLFDHKTHASQLGYGLSCGDCHHTLAPDEYDSAESCSACHEIDSGDEDMPKRSEAFHQQCIGCHDQFGAGPSECAQCHVM